MWLYRSSLCSFSLDTELPCNELTYKCKNNKCISKVNPECDGTNDCEDGSDEQDCSTSQALHLLFDLFFLTEPGVNFHRPAQQAATSQGQRLIVGFLLCRLREEHVHKVTYCRGSGRRSGGVSLAGQPARQKLRTRVRRIHHQSHVAGHRCPLRARRRQDEVRTFSVSVFLRPTYTCCLHTRSKHC